MPDNLRGYTNAHLIIETDDLEAQLSDPGLRIIDANVRMSIKEDGGHKIESGRPDWVVEHIPNSCFIDLNSELSANHPTLNFMMPRSQQFEKVMSEAGIGNENRLVLYSRGVNYWATRLFLMFRAMGFESVQVLNGGWDKWKAEHRPTTTEVPNWPTAEFKANPAPGQFISKYDVLAAIGDPTTCIINALAPEIYSGEKMSPAYKRAGHIKGSVNVYCYNLVDPATKVFLPAAKLREKFDAVGALDKDRVITYCGGGIAATTDSFALLLLGHPNVALYDGSMTDWGPDESMPMETGK